MRGLLVFLGLFVYQVICENLTQPSHTGLTQAARLNCWKTETEFFMRFLLYKYNDRVDIVYSVDYQNLGDMSLGVFDSDGNGIEGNGTEDFPFTFVVNGTGDLVSGIVLSPPASTEWKARVLGTDVIRVDVMSKSRHVPSLVPYVVFAEDVVYAAACNFSEVSDIIVGTSGISVDGSSIEGAPQIKDTAKLQAVVNAATTTTVTIGQEMSLLAVVNPPSIATGLHVYNCKICDRADCGGPVQVEFIDGYGCSIGNYIFPFENAGYLAASTPDFPVFSLANQSSVFFQCTVSFCYDAADLRCENLCLVNTAVRRKRDVNETAPLISIQKERGNKPAPINEVKPFNGSINGNDTEANNATVNQEEPVNATRLQSASQSADGKESANRTKVFTAVGDKEQYITMTLEITVKTPSPDPVVSQARIASPGDTDITLLAAILTVVGVLLIIMTVTIVVFCRAKNRSKAT